MKVIFDRSFEKSLNRIHDQNLKSRIEKTILQVDEISEISLLPNVKKMQGFKNFYRIRIGDFRIGIELENTETIRFLIIAHRKDIYKLFPKYLEYCFYHPKFALLKTAL